MDQYLRYLAALIILKDKKKKLVLIQKIVSLLLFFSLCSVNEIVAPKLHLVFDVKFLSLFFSTLFFWHEHLSRSSNNLFNIKIRPSYFSPADTDAEGDLSTSSASSLKEISAFNAIHLKLLFPNEMQIEDTLLYVN